MLGGVGELVIYYADCKGAGIRFLYVQGIDTICLAVKYHIKGTAYFLSLCVYHRFCEMHFVFAFVNSKGTRSIGDYFVVTFAKADERRARHKKNGEQRSKQAFNKHGTRVHQNAENVKISAV